MLDGGLDPGIDGGELCSWVGDAPSRLFVNAACADVEPLIPLAQCIFLADGGHGDAKGGGVRVGSCRGLDGAKRGECIIQVLL